MVSVARMGAGESMPLVCLTLFIQPRSLGTIQLPKQEKLERACCMRSTKERLGDMLSNPRGFCLNRQKIVWRYERQKLRYLL